MADFTSYTIKPGDTLSSIAQNSNSNVADIAKANNITDVNKITAGASLNIPTVVSTTPTVTPTNPVASPVANPVTSYGAITTPTTPVVGTITPPQPSPVPQVDPLAQAKANMEMFKTPDNPYQTERNNLLAEFKTNSETDANKEAERVALNAKEFDGVGSVNTNRKLVSDLTNQILANNNSAKASGLAVGKFGDTTETAYNNEGARYDREAAIRNLTLSAQLSAAQGNLALAEQQVKDSISAKYDPIEKRIETLKTFLDANSADLTRYDQKAYNDQKNLIDEYSRQVQAKKDIDEAIQKIALTVSGNGGDAATVNRVLNAKDVNTAIANATKFIQDPMEKQLKQAQLAQIYSNIQKNNMDMAKTASEISNTANRILDPKVLESPAYKTAAAIGPVRDAIQAYKDAVTKYGSSEHLSGEGSGALQTAYGNAIAAWKTLAGLGALSGADFGLAENVIPAPSLYTRNSVFQAKLDGAIANANNQIEAPLKALKLAYPNSATGIDELLNPTNMSKAPVNQSQVSTYQAGGKTYVQGADGLYYEKK